jgi:hypothetical protein
MLKSIPTLLLFTIPLSSSCVFVVDDDHGGPYVTTDGRVIEPSGREARDPRNLAAFRRIVAHGTIDVDVRLGAPQSVTVVTDDNLTGWVSTSVSEGVLTIDWDAPRVKSGSMTFHAPRVEIVVASLDSLSLDGMGDVRVDGLNGGALAIEIGGSGSVQARGRVDRLQLYASGFGDANLFDLRASSADVSVTGSGDVEVDVRDQLRASVTGSGTVQYRGHPHDVSKSVAGPGGVEADED